MNTDNVAHNFYDDEDAVRVTIEMNEFDQRKLDERVKRRSVDHCDDDTFVSQRTAAQRLDCAVNTFRNAVERTGLTRHIMGRLVRYRWGDIREKILKKEATGDDDR